MGKKVERYSDIIDLPHHQSGRRPHMSVYNRSAQFAPFAALVGYEQMVQDAADTLLHEKKKELGEDDKRLLDEKIQILRRHLKEQPEIEVIFYDDKARVESGAYRLVSGRLKKIEEYLCVLVLECNIRIKYEDIIDIQGGFFDKKVLN